MLQEIYFFVRESPEGGYEAEALNHSIYTDADTLEELRTMIKDAVTCRYQVTRLHGAIHGWYSARQSVTLSGSTAAVEASR